MGRFILCSKLYINTYKIFKERRTDSVEVTEGKVMAGEAQENTCEGHSAKEREVNGGEG